MIERLELSNFTVFEKLDMPFSPGINIIIGANGTGKTHILKILYSVLESQSKNIPLGDKLVKVFLPKDNHIGRLVTRHPGRAKATIAITYDSQPFRFQFSTLKQLEVKYLQKGWDNKSIGESTFIPVKEFLSHAPGFMSLYGQRAIHFDETYNDLLEKALLPPLLGKPSLFRRKMLKMLEKNIEGKVVIKKEMFYLKNKQGELEFDLLAEGTSKLGLLWLLIQNGTLERGTTLFWDEPEANLNPSMFATLVNILLSLQKDGVQIFIATHSYVFLKEFDIQKKAEDEVKFFSLDYEASKKSVVVAKGENYLSIVPNPIIDAYSRLYDEEIKKAFGGNVS